MAEAARRTGKRSSSSEEELELRQTEKRPAVRWPWQNHTKPPDQLAQGVVPQQGVVPWQGEIEPMVSEQEVRDDMKLEEGSMSWGKRLEGWLDEFETWRSSPPHEGGPTAPTRAGPSDPIEVDDHIGLDSLLDELNDSFPDPAVDERPMQPEQPRGRGLCGMQMTAPALCCVAQRKGQPHAPHAPQRKLLANGAPPPANGLGPAGKQPQPKPTGPAWPAASKPAAPPRPTGPKAGGIVWKPMYQPGSK